MASSTLMHSPALLRNSAADMPAAPLAFAAEKRSCGVAMRQRRGAHFGELPEESFFGQSVSTGKPAPAVAGCRTVKRSAVKAAATFDTKTKVAVVRIGTRGRLVPSGVLNSWIRGKFHMRVSF